MPNEKSYFGLFKEAEWRYGPIKELPDYRRFEAIRDRIHQKQRLLFLERKAGSLTLGTMYLLTCRRKGDEQKRSDQDVSAKDKDPYLARKSHLFFIKHYISAPSFNLASLLEEFFLDGVNQIQKFYSDRFKDFQFLTLGRYENFDSFQKDLKKISAPRNVTLLDYFSGKMLLGERCNIISSNFLWSLGFIVGLYDQIQSYHEDFVMVVSELDDPGDERLDCDLLVRKPIPGEQSQIHREAFLYNADTGEFSESQYTLNLYKQLKDFYLKYRKSIPHKYGSLEFKTELINTFVNSRDWSKEPIVNLCESQLGIKIATRVVVDKINKNERVDPDHIRKIYRSLREPEKTTFILLLINKDVDLPDAYSDAIKAIVQNDNKEILSHYLYKDFPEYRSYKQNLTATFQSLPWHDGLFSAKATSILENILQTHMIKDLGEGGKWFIISLHNSLKSGLTQDFYEKYEGKLLALGIPPRERSKKKDTRLLFVLLVVGLLIAGILIGFILASLVDLSWFFNGPVNTTTSPVPTPIPTSLPPTTQSMISATVSPTVPPTISTETTTNIPLWDINGRYGR